MVSLEPNRLKWNIIETVSDYFREHFNEEADSLEEKFTQELDTLLSKYDVDSIEFLHLIKEFKPALSLVLEPGPHFDRLMGLVSPLLNTALASVEQQKIKCPILLDTLGTVARQYDARRTPHMFVIDKKGILRYHGAIDNNPLLTKQEDEITNYVVQAVRQIINEETVEPDHVEPYGCTVKLKRTVPGG